MRSCCFFFVFAVSFSFSSFAQAPTPTERAEALTVLASAVRDTDGDRQLHEAAFGGIIALSPVEPGQGRKAAVRTIATLMKVRAATTEKEKEKKEQLLQAALAVTVLLATTTPGLDENQRVAAILAEVKQLGTDASDVGAEWNLYRCARAQAPARSNLKSLYVAEESYRAEYDTYSTDFQAIGYVERAVGRYRVRVEKATATSFFARAVSGNGDEWTITEKNDLVNVKRVCDP